MSTVTGQCPRCNGNGEEYYQARDGEYVLAACDMCGNGQVGSKGTGRAPRVCGGCPPPRPRASGASAPLV